MTSLANYNIGPAAPNPGGSVLNGPPFFYHRHSHPIGTSATAAANDDIPVDPHYPLPHYQYGHSVSLPPPHHLVPTQQHSNQQSTANSSISSTASTSQLPPPPPPPQLPPSQLQQPATIVPSSASQAHYQQHLHQQQQQQQVPQYYYQPQYAQPHYITYYQPPPYTSPSAIMDPNQSSYFAGTERRRSKQSSTWTPKEDKLLRELKEVQKLGWREISTFFPDRTPNACQFRWRRIISGTSSGAAGSTSAGHSARNSISETGNESELQEAIEGSPSESNAAVPMSPSSRSSTDASGLDSSKNLNKKSLHSINFLLN